MTQHSALAALPTGFRGDLIEPGDDRYDDARAVWNGLCDRRPAVIARCAGTDDVVAALGAARAAGLPVAVRGGGHSASGFSTVDGGMVIDLAPMKAIAIDAEAMTCRAQAGMTWGEFDAATQEHGLALTGGRFSTTGIAGLTLGSGSGWLERKCGLTADNLLSAEVVLADGTVVRASEEEHPELFWGLHGGGGNFGIVTEFEYRLHRVGPIIYGGLLGALPDRAGDILRFLRDYMVDAPEDLGIGVSFISVPPEPFVPPAMHGAPAVGIIVCWTGDHEEGERVVAPLREVAQPVLDMVQPMPYVALQSMLDGGGPKGIRAYMKAEFLDGLGDDVVDKLIAHGAARPGPMVQLLLEPLGGAMTDVEDAATALGRRDVPWVYHALSMWLEPGEEARAAHVAWAKDLAADMAAHTTPGVYLNFTSDTGDEKVRSSFGAERFARLQAVKDRYDPENVFRLNQNIKPSSTG